MLALDCFSSCCIAGAYTGAEDMYAKPDCDDLSSELTAKQGLSLT